MLSLPGNARIFLSKNPMDMRKGFEGLAGVIEQDYEDEITSGAFFAFVNRRKDRMKVLYWDGDGLVIWYKRLESGTFSSKAGDCLITRRQFLMLLEGIIPKRLKRRYTHS